MTAGCIPSRDNPYDPAIAPDALLSIVDLGALDDVACLAAVAGTSAEPVAVASRGRCLALDGRASRDPQGGSLNFRFRLPEDEAWLPDDDGLLVIDPVARRTLPVGEVLTFELEASDGGGARAIVSASVVLTNARPIAVAPPPRTVSAGGYPWAPGLPLPIRFDGRASFDPDGDPIYYLWTRPDATTTTAAVFTLDVDSSEVLVTATLTVRDNPGAPDGGTTLESRADPGIVRFAPRESLWGQASSSFGGAPQRFDQDPPLALDTSNEVARILSLPPGVGDPVDRILEVRTIDTVYEFEWVVRNADSGAVEAVVQTPEPDSYGEGFDPVSRRLWAVTRTGTGIANLRAYDLAPDGTLLEVAIGPFPLPGVTSASLVTPVENGPIFVSDGESVLRVEPGSPTPVRSFDIAPDTTVVALAARPGRGELWQISNSNSYGGIPRRAFLTVRDLWGNVLLEDLELGERLLRGFWWIGADDAWVHAEGDGARRVDALLLEAGVSLEDATLFRVPFPPTTILGGAAGISRSLWVSSPSAVLLVRPDGTSERANIGNVVASAVDAEGRLWYGKANGLGGTEKGLFRTATFDERGQITSNLFDAQVITSVDPASGWVWFFTGAPPVLVLMGGDGEIVRYEETVIIDGVPGATPPVTSSLVVAPDGETAWTAQIGFDASLGGIVVKAFYRIDLTTIPASFETILTGTQAAPLVTPFLTVGPSTPSAAGEFVWLVRRDVSDETWLIQLRPDGGFTERLAFTGVDDSPPPAAPRSLRSDRACAAWISSNGGFTLHVRWVDPDPSVPDEVVADLLLSPPFEGLVGVAVSSDGAGGDACWTVFGEGGTTCALQDLRILGWSTAGGPAWSVDLPDAGNLGSLAPRSPDDVWLTRYCQTGAISPARTHLRHDGATGTWTRRDLPLQQSLFLTSPERGYP